MLIICCDLFRHMDSKKVVWILSVGIFISIGSMMLSWNTSHVYAAVINCTGVVGVCNGTPGNDGMLGDDNRNQICGRDGSDNIDLRGNPIVQGDPTASTEEGAGAGGNDIINGGLGNDFLVGDSTDGNGVVPCAGGPFGGTDRLVGGPGNDQIFHGNVAQSTDETASDNHKD